MPRLRIRITPRPPDSEGAVAAVRIEDLHPQYTLVLVQKILDRAARDQTEVRIVLKTGERVILNPHECQSVAVVDEELLERNDDRAQD